MSAAPDLDGGEQLPHDVDLPHPPEACAAHADAQHTPRWVACEAHWMPTALRKAREDRAALVADHVHAAELHYWRHIDMTVTYHQRAVEDAGVEAGPNPEGGLVR